MTALLKVQPDRLPEERLFFCCATHPSSYISGVHLGAFFELHFSKFAVLICAIFVMLKCLRGNHSVLVEVWGIILMLMVGWPCLVACVFV